MFGRLDLSFRFFIWLNGEFSCRERESYSITHVSSDSLTTNICSSAYIVALTSAFVDEKAAGSSEVNFVIELEALQVLTHFPALGEFRVDIFEVNLWTRDDKKIGLEKQKLNYLTVQQQLFLFYYILTTVPSPPNPRSLCHHRLRSACKDGPQAFRLSLQTNRYAGLRKETDVLWSIWFLILVFAYTYTWLECTY